MKSIVSSASLSLALVSVALLPIPVQADPTILRSHSLIVRPKPPVVQEDPATQNQASDRKEKGQAGRSPSTSHSSSRTLAAPPRVAPPIRLLSMGSRKPSDASSAQGNHVRPSTESSTETDPTAAQTRSAKSLLHRGDGMSRFSLTVAPSPPIVLVPSQIPLSNPPAADPQTVQPPIPTTGTAILSWAPTVEGTPAGYRVYVGTSSGLYGYAGPFDVTGGTSFTLSDLPLGHTYYFAVSAFDQWGNESPKSDEVSKNIY